ncbi:MAG: hypothetical protein JO033_03350 [Acidobacteriaceae bacterium]|nr:hypothetical protein [Acidobacteriaceae bacterium]
MSANLREIRVQFRGILRVLMNRTAGVVRRSQFFYIFATACRGTSKASLETP